MYRFFTPQENIKEKIIISDKKEIHHLKDVLRLKENDQIIVFDGRGREYLGKINSLKNDVVIILPLESINKELRRTLSIHLACALPKKAKFDYVVEKLTELQVNKITPLKTKRTIVQLNQNRLPLKLKHWQNIAINASKQSKNNYVPQIQVIKSFSDVISTAKDYDLVLLPCLAHERKSLKELLDNFQGSSILVLIGPEGDFTPEEIEMAIQNNAQPVSLGETVLKVDTACISIISILNYCLKDKYKF